MREGEKMNYYFAPLEGVTGYIFRNAHHKYYGGVDKYFAPFVSPVKECILTPREKRDLAPENNEGICLVPQILTNNAEAFILTALKLKEMGYKEVNLNLGCPSGTVTAKGKGSGFLARTVELESFFEKVYGCDEISDMELSIKTRLGKNDTEEFYELLELFNRYPISELTIHPRIQKEFYKGVPHREYFEYAVENSKNPLIYNGDLCTAEDVKTLLEAIPEKKSVKGEDIVKGFMFGRGLLKNPALCEELSGLSDGCPDKERLKTFHDEIYHGYQEIMAPDKNVIFRMKELWSYLITAFPGKEKMLKKIRKAEHYSEYESVVMQLFQE